MKLNTLLEHILAEDDTDDIMNQLRQARDEDEKRFTNIRNTLNRKEIAFLSRMIKRKREKKGMTTNIPDDILSLFQMLGLLDDHGHLTSEAPRFLRWVNKNPSREMDYIDKRTDANDALTRGQLKRDNDWVPRIQKRARAIVRNMTPEDQELFRKLYNRYINKKTRNLATSWKNVPENDVINLQRMGVLDDDGNLTELGDFAIKYYIAFKNDPDGLDRVSKYQRIGNYGNARKRRQNRANRIIKPTS